VHTGGGDDRVLVDSDPDHGEPDRGEWRVAVNGRVLRFPAGTRITVRAGAGDDDVAVSGTVGITVLGGAGDDVLLGGDGQDRLQGGTGDNYLDGGDGDDVLSGGPGDDVGYGGDGADRIDGGDGRDYPEGGGGVDVLDGGPGDDVVSGGSGDDVLRGGAGDDRLYAGLGDDVVDGTAGSDTAYLTRGDRHTNVEAVRTVQVTELDSPIRVEGTAAFVERVRADLRLLQASPIGQRMLAELDRGDTIVIVEDESTSASWTALDLPGGRRFTVFTVAYNTMRGVSADRSPPIIGLFHELAHVYDFLNQTGASGVHQDPNDPDWVTGEDGTPAGAANDERAAVGLPIDHDGDPTTPHRIDPDHPYELTENALRDEMAIPPRRRYGR